MTTHTIPTDVATTLWEMRGTDGSHGGYTPVHDEQTGSDRWHSQHRLIVRRDADGTFWELPYELGLTEYQEADLFYDDPVTVTQVQAQEVVTVVYVPMRSEEQG